MATFRSTAVTNSPSTNINLQAVTVRGVSICNRHSAVIYVRFYDSDVATFQDTPIFTVAVQATSQFIVPSPSPQMPIFASTNGLCARVVTDTAENGNTAAATLPEIVVQFE